MTNCQPEHRLHWESFKTVSNLCQSLARHSQLVLRDSLSVLVSRWWSLSEKVSVSALHCIHQPVLLCKPRRILPNRSQASAFTYDNWLLLFNCDQHSSCCECCLRFFGPAAANCARSSSRISQSRILAHLLLFVVTTLWLLCVAALWSQDADVLFWSLALFTQFAIKTPKSRRYLSNPWMPSEKFFFDTS